jgi:hypothetical protein
MSRLPLSVIISQQHHIQRMIYDVNNELETTKCYLRHLETQLLQTQQQYELLQTQLQEKQNILKDWNILLKSKQNQIGKDKYNEKKILYSLRCQQYLTTFSEFNYNFEEMCCDDIISFAHKLHFILCLQNYTTPLEYIPINENDFENFEKNHNFEDNIYLSPNIFINFVTYSNITEYNNSLSFTIDSDMSLLNSEIHHLLNLSPEISWTITS